ncbi:hypothetical protein A3C96_02315 [Candidatus Uhrbacteria bacterium RIFCSPHIGHO2_02_FULL_60_10]|uniref:Deoxynucleoside kinase domain-containing protein n=1 Tax=Candidatus Uhrbacteria bacterium RIFCSPHIGHO2_02_FULL_60_10 TaxID=1802392 RepID=A0A1F7U5I1_9BACT|nr:MAG: hypothetical protein A3C96_02315 [Candidatus Uhrbacteria bacterium RIFCSPHIGHO2_02_FULL_60_10]
MKRLSFEQKAADLISCFDPEQVRKVLWPRPFMVELYGTPKAGKSTIKEMLKHFFKRSGWSVSTPTEGAEIVEWSKRREPDYNFQTAEYALSFARDRMDDKRFHLVLFDRAVFDGVVRMDYYRERGTMTPDQQQTVESYLLLPFNRGMFDLHVCLVCDPEIAIKRELARALVKKHGETMNPQTLAELYQAHERVWSRLGAGSATMCWHDSTREKESETAFAVLEAVMAAFERRLAASEKK